MAKNIIQFNNTYSTKTDAVMSSMDAVKQILIYSPTPVNDVYQLDNDDKAKIAAGCFEEINREDGSEILELHDLNSDVNCKIIALLNDDNLDTRDDLCDAIKKAFITYFKDEIAESVEKTLEQRTVTHD